jgi:hypothetical protein
MLGETLRVQHQMPHYQHRTQESQVELTAASHSNEEDVRRAMEATNTQLPSPSFLYNTNQHSHKPDESRNFTPSRTFMKVMEKCGVYEKKLTVSPRVRRNGPKERFMEEGAGSVEGKSIIVSTKVGSANKNIAAPDSETKTIK